MPRCVSLALRLLPSLLFLTPNLLRHEAKLIAGLVVYLLKQGYTGQGDITVLTPYLGQLFVLKDIVGNSSLLHVQVDVLQRPRTNSPLCKSRIETLGGKGHMKHAKATRVGVDLSW